MAAATSGQTRNFPLNWATLNNCFTKIIAKLNTFFVAARLPHMPQSRRPCNKITTGRKDVLLVLSQRLVDLDGHEQQTSRHSKCKNPLLLFAFPPKTLPLSPSCTFPDDPIPSRRDKSVLQRAARPLRYPFPSTPAQQAWGSTYHSRVAT